jgi:hypothetical protein
MTVPFGLSAFDEAGSKQVTDTLSQTARRVETICRPLLHKPSKEGEYAALTLAKLYARPDCIVGLRSYLLWTKNDLDVRPDQFDGNAAIYVSLSPDLHELTSKEPLTL